MTEPVVLTQMEMVGLTPPRNGQQVLWVMQIVILMMLPSGKIRMETVSVTASQEFREMIARLRLEAVR
jgi:hypothetical protein